MKTISSPVVTLMTVAWLVAGCDTPHGPTPPPGPGTSGPPSVPAGTVTLSGRVFEIGPGSRTPAANRSLWAAVGPPPLVSGAISTFFTTTDSSGRYTITQLPAGHIAVVHAGSTDYPQLCAAGLQLRAGAAELDVEITSSANPQPSPTMPHLIISGQIYEMTSAGRVGIAGAYFGVDWNVDSPLFGGLFTDADGRYSLCGIPRGWLIEFLAGKPGRYTDVAIWRGFDANTTFDVELKRLN